MPAITVNLPRPEVEREWRASGPGLDATFKDAPGDRGTEIHVRSDAPLDEVKIELRQFKQRIETGEVPIASKDHDLEEAHA